MKILKDGGNGNVILNTDGLPIVYFDSTIVFNSGNYKGSPVRLLKL
jgi:hypothetical protein